MNKITYILLIPFGVLFFLSCKNTPSKKDSYQIPVNSKIVTLQLIASLGAVSFSIPEEYDTSFSWIHEGDCGKPCEESKCRFQSKKLPIMMENGWLWNEPKDSIENLTVSYSTYIPFRPSDTSKNLALHNGFKGQVITNSINPPLIIDTLQRINDRYFSIFVMKRFDSVTSIKALAITTIKGNRIQFQYQFLKKGNDATSKDFAEKALNYFKTIVIKEGI